jgi:hypothetical protein
VSEDQIEACGLYIKVSPSYDRGSHSDKSNDWNSRLKGREDIELLLYIRGWPCCMQHGGSHRHTSFGKFQVPSQCSGCTRVYKYIYSNLVNIVINDWEFCTKINLILSPVNLTLKWGLVASDHVKYILFVLEEWLSGGRPLSNLIWRWRMHVHWQTENNSSPWQCLLLVYRLW